jgi:HAD superfamily hydrolase (TIGR01509 family)
MLFTDEVQWNEAVAYGVILLALGGLYELWRWLKTRTRAYRVAFIIGFAGLFLLGWVSGAVGIIGSENNPANLMYWAVPVILLVGSLISRFKASGMAWTLFTTGVVQILVPVVALFIWPARASWGDAGVIGVFVINLVFALLFVASGLLFRRAGIMGEKPQNNKEKIKAIVFDFGGVIELYDDGDILKKISELLGVDYVEFKKEYFKHNHLMNVNNISWEDMILEVAFVFPDSKGKKNQIKEIINESRSKNKINFELLSFLKVLRRQGFKVAIFSNSTAKLRERLIAENIAGLVDEIVISGEIGYQKPHKEAFQALFEKLGVQANEVIFVDDSEKSLEKAPEIGYAPILFKNNEQLKIELNRQGVSLNQ